MDGEAPERVSRRTLDGTGNNGNWGHGGDEETREEAGRYWGVCEGFFLGLSCNNGGGAGERQVALTNSLTM